MSIVSGQHQSGGVGEELPQPIVARVLNKSGDPIAGQLVNFRVVKGDGSVFAGASLTDANGLAQERWTLGKLVADSQVVEARAVNSSTGEALVFARFVATPVAGPPTAIELTAGNSQIGMVGTELLQTLAIRVSDAYGNAVAARPVDWSVASGGGTLAHAKDTTSESGYASNAWTLGNEVGEQTVRASVSAEMFTTFTAFGSLKSPLVVEKYEDGQSAAPGTAVAKAPRVRVTDSQGHPVAGIAVTFTVASGGGTVTGATAVTNGVGNAEVGSWTLGGQTGINTLLATIAGAPNVVFTATAVYQSPDINVAVGPPSNGIVGDTVAIEAFVTSRAQLVSVKATVSNRTVSLTPGSPGEWHGIISLVGAPRDTMTFISTATDVNGAFAQAVRSLIHDRAPRVVWAAPSDNSVARPEINFAAQCDDDDAPGCTLTVRTFDGRTQLVGPSSSINTSVSLSAFEGQRVDLSVTATDSRNQSTAVTRTIWVESSPQLQLIGSAEGKVMDASDTRLLWETSFNNTTSIGVRSLTGGVSDTIARNLAEGSYQGVLTPTGAAFPVSMSAPPYGALLYLWRSGSLSTTAIAPNGLNAAGPYITYTSSSGSLVRTDVVSGANVTVTAESGYDNSVAENGNVAYSTSSYDIALFNGSSTTEVTSDADSFRWNVGVVTDGINIVFKRQLPCCPINNAESEIWLYDGTTSSALAPPRNKEVSPPVDYVVNAGWVAFTKLDANLIAQVWTRSPTGTLRAVSAVDERSVIEALGSDWSVVFSGGLSRYLAGPVSSPQRISSALGRVVWRDGRFVALIGNSAFAITP